MWDVGGGLVLLVLLLSTSSHDRALLCTEHTILFYTSIIRLGVVNDVDKVRHSFRAWSEFCSRLLKIALATAA